MKTTTKSPTKKPTKKAVKKPRAKVEPLSITDELEPVIEAPAAPEVQEALVISLANNPMYVYASLDGTKITVKVPVWMAPKLLKKAIKVTKQIGSEHYEIYTQ